LCLVCGLHLVGILFPHNIDDAWSKPHQNAKHSVETSNKVDASSIHACTQFILNKLGIKIYINTNKG
jgi:hypothetical protein